MSNKFLVKSSSNQKQFHTPYATCKTKLVVYLAECKQCDKQYVGRTVQQLGDRISGHRGWMNRNKPKYIDSKFEDEEEAALAEHLRTVHGLSSSDNFISTYLFTVLRICQPNKIDNLEYEWISVMRTLTPFGLNIAKVYRIWPG